MGFIRDVTLGGSVGNSILGHSHFLVKHDNETGQTTLGSLPFPSGNAIILERETGFIGI